MSAGRSNIPQLNSIIAINRLVIGAVLLARLALPAVTLSSDEALPEKDRPTVVVLGDSLAAGYGLDLSEAFPALLQKKVDEAGLKFSIVNAGISGDTSAGGLRRIDWLLKRRVDVLVLELGGNDGLRGLPVSRVQANLALLITKSRAAGADVLLLAVQVPSNYGPQYTSSFQQIYRDLAVKYRIGVAALMNPQVALDLTYFQADGIHPNARAQPLLLDNIWIQLTPLLRP